MFEYTKTIINGVKVWCRSEIDRVRKALEPLIAKAQKTADAKANTANPVFTGSFSQNRKGNTTVGPDSHSEGYNTTASGLYSHAEGEGTTAQRKSQHVQGEHNILDTEGTVTARGKYAHIVGNGTSDIARSNAHTLDWDGNAWYAGYVEGTALILKSTTAGSTKRFRITVDDTGTLSATEVT